ncbi:hypothetical protein GCM10009425_24530 [Pseudomonas asuensis]|uniref:Transposase n=1 Tax=Pseudomonas asuensis TaxID=1825787 RepID=A0ABQ2GUU8_9PSED|nr:hypothetical protein GCM10009425_24530 [Pseudomonas asuensis]
MLVPAANETMHGAPLLGEAFDEPPAEWTSGRQVNIRQRGSDKRILPAYLLYMV